MITRKIGPALAAGCTVLVKPAEDTPLSSLLLAEVLQNAGVPSGVVNILPTSDPATLVTAVTADPRLRKISFTGSTAVGKQLLGAASENVLRVSMELGGNSPLIVFEDADLNQAAEQAMLAKMRNGGESCVAANRILVQASVLTEFSQLLAEKMRNVTVGPGDDPNSTLGPMINGRQLERVQVLVDDAIANGSTVVTGGSAMGRPGYFFEPTVLTDVPRNARIFSEEIFGPVAAIYTFADEAEAIRLANDTPHGLVSYIFTKDLSRAIRVSEALEAGMVGVNRGLVSNAAAPFGGVKQSGLGREGGFEGIHEYLSPKYLAIDAI